MFLEYDMGNESLIQSYTTFKTQQTSLLPFTISAVGNFICDKNYFVKRQGLDNFLLLYTIDGEGIIEYENKKMVLSPGQLLILNCRKYHYYSTKGHLWHFMWIHFDGKCASEYVELLNTNENIILTLDPQNNIAGYFDQLFYNSKHFNLRNEMEISIIMHKLLTELIYSKKAEVFSLKYGRFDSKLEDSIDYLQEHFMEDVSITQLAEQMHLSKYYFIKVFKSYTGQSPYDYLLGIRIQRAQKMLLETDYTISIIAEECGFTNSKNFIPCFKNKVGMTPLQYRKTLRHRMIK